MQTQNALHEFIKAAKLKPEEPEYKYWLACTFSKTGDNDKALAEYKKILKLASKEDPRAKKIKDIITRYGNGKEKL